MPLRGKKPSEIAKNKRLKMFIFGQAKVGKTTAAINFPRPYLIDTEKGAENKKYTDILEENGGAIFQSTEYEEINKEILSLTSEKHPFKTVIIDPITIIYDILVIQSAANVGTDFGRHYAEAGKKMKNIIHLLFRLDMNVIVTAHSKPQYGENLVILDQTFDGYKKLDYMFDLILYAERRGKRRVATVRGSRLIGFKEDDSFDLSYQEISSRYSKDIMEKESDNIELSSEKSIEKINNLINIFKISKEDIEKFFNKFDVLCFEEMKEEDIQKCISYISKKYNDLA